MSKMMTSLPTKPEMLHNMLTGTTLWWEQDKDSKKWSFFYAIYTDVYDHVFHIRELRALVKIYGLKLPFEDINRVFMKEAPSFAEKKNGEFVDMREWSSQCWEASFAPRIEG